MELSIIAFNKILVMFCIVIVGAIAYRTKLISRVLNKKLSDVLLMLVNPLLIFMAYQVDFDFKLFKGFLISVLFAFIGHFVGIFISYALIRKKVKDSEIERISCIYSNCGFMGIPLINALFGSEGVFYLAAYMTTFNLLLWTQGLMLMTDKRDNKTIIKAITSPCIIAVILGIILFVAKIKLPQIIGDSFNSIASMNTPLAMIIAGVTIAQTNIIKALKKLRSYYICILKLLLIPIITAFILSLFKSDEVVTLTSIVEVACPTAASGTLFALRFRKNSLYASELFALTTIFSVITLPVVIIIAKMF